MFRQPTKRENEKFSPMCATHGKTPAECRALISEGRKVGFILSFGTIPSKHCFQQTPPTQSFSKVPRPTGSITLIPDNWKVSNICPKDIVITRVQQLMMMMMINITRLQSMCGIRCTWERFDTTHQEFPSIAFLVLKVPTYWIARIGVMHQPRHLFKFP